MKNQPSPATLHVFASVGPKVIPLGELSYVGKNNSGSFLWSQEAIDLGVEWSPIHCPLSSSLWKSTQNENTLLGAMPGFIHDALPDGWGLLLMDRAFLKAKIAKSSITPLLRLAFLADRSWGALSFEPTWSGVAPKSKSVHLEKIFVESQKILKGTLSDVSEQMILTGGSPQGARPKVFVALDQQNANAIHGDGVIQPGYRHVIVKFAGQGETPSHPILESCYINAARQAHITVPPSTLLDLNGNPAVCVDRFDRQQGEKVHVHSLAGMLHTSHTISNTDWTAVRDILARINAPSKDIEQALRRAVFNAVFCVRDDHTKNLAFSRDAKGSWSLAPAFDIAYSQGPGGYHSMLYAQHGGEHVETKDLQRLANRFGVDFSIVQSWISDCKDIRSQMLTEAKKLGVSKDLLQEARLQFKAIDQALKKAPSKKLSV